MNSIIQNINNFNDINFKIIKITLLTITISLYPILLIYDKFLCNTPIFRTLFLLHNKENYKIDYIQERMFFIKNKFFTKKIFKEINNIENNNNLNDSKKIQLLNITSRQNNYKFYNKQKQLIILNSATITLIKCAIVNNRKNLEEDIKEILSNKFDKKYKTIYNEHIINNIKKQQFKNIPTVKIIYFLYILSTYINKISFNEIYFYIITLIITFFIKIKKLLIIKKYINDKIILSTYSILLIYKIIYNILSIFINFLQIIEMQKNKLIYKAFSYKNLDSYCYDYTNDKNLITKLDKHQYYINNKNIINNINFNPKIINLLQDTIILFMMTNYL